MSIFSVFIEEGCITCDACEEAAPDVFEVTDDTCYIKPDARLDGGYDRNTEKSGLKPDVINTLSDDIMDAADACPVDVIILVEEAEGDAVPEPEVADDTEPEVADAVEEPAEVGEGLEGLLSSGDRSLNILFGSQSGNSEELAAKFAKRTSDYGLETTVHDMDGFDLSSMSSMKRVLIICSTWGEGDMPDNAEELWLEANSDSAPNLESTFFSVLALGDTSYEFFCESGKDWDQKLEQLGATRLVDRVDCCLLYTSPSPRDS